MSYLIRVTRHYYAGQLGAERTQYIGAHGNASAAPLVPFDSKEAARSFAQKIKDGGPYYLGPGECSPPTYAVVKVSSANKWVRERAEAGRKLAAHK